MKITARSHTIGIVCIRCFLGIIALSLFFVWAGTLEMIVQGRTLPAIFISRYSLVSLRGWAVFPLSVSGFLDDTHMRGYWRQIFLADLVTYLAVSLFILDLFILCGSAA